MAGNFLSSKESRETMKEIAKRVLIGITGSISAYKTPLLVRELIKNGIEVRVAMTPTATRFVSPLTLENLTRHPVAVDMFDERIQNDGSWHVHLSHWCDAMLIAPCSATTLAKLSSGNCDNTVTALAMSLPEKTPLLVSPAMDTEMWLHPATQRNVRSIEQDGALVIEPEEGELASGLYGPGRLPEIDALTSHVLKLLNRMELISQNEEMMRTVDAALQQPVYDLQEGVDHDAFDAELELQHLKESLPISEQLRGRVVLITAGPTREKIDDVRYISNHSSGKMGYALAEIARDAGAEVVLISGPVDLPEPDGIRFESVESAQEMLQAVQVHWTDADVGIFAAAVADYTPVAPANGKIKKSDEEVEFVLKKTADILAWAGENKGNKAVIGFALEAENGLENAKAKLEKKNADMIVLNMVNQPQSGFGGDHNTITLVGKHGEQSFDPMMKTQCARLILAAAGELLGSSKST